ncbi:hypothetical protein JCM6882_008423 [Rhodosporidiobolus microsporus]
MGQEVRESKKRRTRSRSPSLEAKEENKPDARAQPDEEGEEPSRSPSAAPLREKAPVEQGQTEQGMPGVDDGEESDLTELEDSDDDVVSSTASDLEDIVEGEDDAPSSASFHLLPLLPEVLSSLPDHIIPSLHPPNSVAAYLISHPNLNLSFERREIGGLEQHTICPGTSKGEWHPERNFLCLKQPKNVCGDGSGISIAPGQPFVFVSLMDRHEKVKRAVGTGVHPDKTQRGIQVFVQEGDTGGNWLYKAKYDIAFDGTTDETAEPVPLGAGEGGSWSRLHPLLQSAFEGHMEPSKKKDWPSKILTSWGFKARTFEDAQEELAAPAAAVDGRKRIMRYLVLRCVGFDEKCFEMWDKKRRGKKKAK